MKAIILAAGFGNRMMPLTRSLHKTLLRAGGQEVLGRIIDVLNRCGINDILIVTGYRSEQLREYVVTHHPESDITWVHNEKFDTTNNIFSLSLAFEKVESEDVIIIESDLVFEPEVIEQLLENPKRDVAMVAPFQVGMDGTVVTVERGLVTQFIPPHLQSDKFDFSDKYKTLNIYKFSAEFAEQVFRPIITFYAQSIDSDCYYESILGVIIYMRRAHVHAEIVDNATWTEIDDPMDLNVAEFQFNPTGRAQILNSSHGGYWKYPFTDFCYIRNMHFPTGNVLSDLRNNLHHLIYNYGSSQNLLDQKLSYFLDCETDHIVLLNGASQAFPVIKQIVGDRAVLRPDPTFGEYSRVFPDARTYADSVGTDTDKIASAIDDAEVVCIINPNNPSGTVLASEGIMELAERHPDRFFIVDESFIDFADEVPVQDLLAKRPLSNVLVLKSLSKVFGVPGIRLGYAYSTDPKIVAAIRESLPIWNINSVAEYFLELLFKRRPELQASFQRTKDDRAAFAELLRRLKGVHEVYSSGGNFLLARLDARVYPSPQIETDLLARYAIYVKDVSDRFEDDDTYVRVAVRTQEDHHRLIEAMGSLAY